jgi:hypothetical protein
MGWACMHPVVRFIEVEQCECASAVDTALAILVELNTTVLYEK